MYFVTSTLSGNKFGMVVTNVKLLFTSLHYLPAASSQWTIGWVDIAIRMPGNLWNIDFGLNKFFQPQEQFFIVYSSLETPKNSEK
jgi:hypothetical protein